MRFVITVTDGKTEWEEEYNKNTTDPERWGRNIIECFNKTLCTYEKPRKFLKVRILSEDNIKHEWAKRTDGMSVSFRGQVADIMYCTRCRITGKRFGLNPDVKRDSKYRAKKYQTCTGKTVLL